MERLKPFFPVGCKISSEISWASAGLFAAVFIAFATFGVRFSAAISDLYDELHPGRLITDAVMPSFRQLLAGSLTGFYAFLAILPLWALFHYLLHFRESKSIYLMRRLPQKNELAKRCLSAPAAAAVIALIAALLSVLLCFIAYCLLTPAPALPQNIRQILSN